MLNINYTLYTTQVPLLTPSTDEEPFIDSTSTYGAQKLPHPIPLVCTDWHINLKFKSSTLHWLYTSNYKSTLTSSPTHFVPLYTNHAHQNTTQPIIGWTYTYAWSRPTILNTANHLIHISCVTRDFTPPYSHHTRPPTNLPLLGSTTHFTPLYSDHTHQTT